VTLNDGTKMSIVKTSNSALDIRIIQEALQEAVKADFRLKALKHPVLVLDIEDKRVLLGSTKEIVGMIQYDYSLKNNLETIVGNIIGDKYVHIELQPAENELKDFKNNIDKISIEKKKNEEILAEIQAQKNTGHCALIPFPLKENKVRSELTIERHALFAANTFKGDFRKYERKVRNPHTGEHFLLRVEIGDSDGGGRGVLKQRHQEAFYKLSQIWSEQEYRIEEDKRSAFGSIELSVYDLVHRLKGDDSGQNYKKALQLLKEMSSIRVNIKRINIDEDTCDIQDFSLLSYEWHARSFSEKTLRPRSDGESMVHIRFSDFITDNFLRKNVKSLMLSPYFSLKDKAGKGIAQLIYTMLDYELASKNSFHISLANLSNRLGLTHYKYKSDRKRKLDPIVRLLGGKIILDGEYKIQAHLEEAEDKRDWILLAKKIALS